MPRVLRVLGIRVTVRLVDIILKLVDDTDRPFQMRVLKLLLFEVGQLPRRLERIPYLPPVELVPGERVDLASDLLDIGAVRSVFEGPDEVVPDLPPAVLVERRVV